MNAKGAVGDGGSGGIAGAGGAGGAGDAGGAGGSGAAALAPITGRQQQLVELIVRGLTNAAIAAELGISVKTVEKHVSEVLRRWGLESRVGIASTARERDIDGSVAAIDASP